MTTPPPPAVRSRTREIAGALAVLGAVLLVLLLWRAQQTVEHDAIRELSGPDRRALYQRTLRTLTASCEPSKQPPGLERFCGEQAAFIVQFPECDQACLQLAKLHQHRPTK